MVWPFDHLSYCKSSIQVPNSAKGTEFDGASRAVDPRIDEPEITLRKQWVGLTVEGDQVTTRHAVGIESNQKKLRNSRNAIPVS